MIKVCAAVIGGTFVLIGGVWGAMEVLDHRYLAPVRELQRIEDEKAAQHQQTHLCGEYLIRLASIENLPPSAHKDRLIRDLQRRAKAAGCNIT